MDSSRFAALVEQAQAAHVPRTRAGLRAEALGLWRGQTLADFADEEFAAAAVARWEEQRLTAVEAHAEARLELGEHRELVAELGDEVRRHPYRERLRAAHIRVLHRAGRTGEACSAPSGRCRRLGAIGVLIGACRTVLTVTFRLSVRPARQRPVPSLWPSAELWAASCFCTSTTQTAVWAVVTVPLWREVVLTYRRAKPSPWIWLAPAVVEGRNRLDTLTQVNVTVGQQLQTSIFILAPLLSGLVGALVPALH